MKDRGKEWQRPTGERRWKVISQDTNQSTTPKQWKKTTRHVITEVQEMELECGHWVRIDLGLLGRKDVGLRWCSECASVTNT